MESDMPCAEKLAFNTKDEAKAAAMFADYTYGSKLKVYKCTHCGLWHLSSS